MARHGRFGAREQPASYACLACIYHHVPNGQIREQAIADRLGIDLDMVKESLISPAAAQRIAAVNPGVTAAHIVGRAYDSLFKALCAEAALSTPEGARCSPRSPS